MNTESFSCSDAEPANLYFKQLFSYRCMMLYMLCDFPMNSPTSPQEGKVNGAVGAPTLNFLSGVQNKCLMWKLLR